MVYLLYDVAIVAIVLFFLWRGISKGFILSLCGLLAVVVAFVGASFLAGVLSPKVGDILEPQIAQVLEEQLTESIQHNEYITDQGGVASVPDEVPLGGVLDVLREMGLYDDLVETIESAAWPTPPSAPPPRWPPRSPRRWPTPSSSSSASSWCSSPGPSLPTLWTWCPGCRCSTSSTAWAAAPSAL